MVAEFKHLWHEERPKITKKVNWAAKSGRVTFRKTRYYQYNKQLLRKIDRRVRYFGKTFGRATYYRLFTRNKKGKSILGRGSILKMMTANKKH